MSIATDFNEFWSRYPRKVGRLVAQKAYEKARKVNGATQAELLAGIDAYIAHKPEYADYAHPKTWLSQGRWMDQWDAPIVKPVERYWYDECQEVHGGTCAKQWDHAMKVRQEKAASA